MSNARFVIRPSAFVISLSPWSEIRVKALPRCALRGGWLGQGPGIPPGDELQVFFYDRDSDALSPSLKSAAARARLLRSGRALALRLNLFYRFRLRSSVESHAACVLPRADVALFILQ